MKHLEVQKLGMNKGAPRVYIQGRKAVLAGFAPGAKYKPTVDEEKCLLTLEVNEE
ncbi:hypothetical protein [Azonexus hydrophilus]|uniref:Uncharacterized protein n=1 Tax=Azonexus hydrophilus TaxID=418702 RepID=A0ABZ2XPT4_9RHOO